MGWSEIRQMKETRRHTQHQTSSGARVRHFISDSTPLDGSNGFEKWSRLAAWYLTMHAQWSRYKPSHSSLPPQTPSAHAACHLHVITRLDDV